MKTIKAHIENDEVIIDPSTPSDVRLDLKPAHKNWDLLRSKGYTACTLAREPKTRDLTWYKPETPEEELEIEIATYDWYYQMSDDSRVWSSGRAKDLRIANLTKVVGKAKFAELWETYVRLNAKNYGDGFVETHLAPLGDKQDE